VGPARPFGYLAEGAPDSATAARPAVESLITLDKTGKIRPALAVSWDIAPDNKSMIIGLRKGVKFHDGSEWNATVAKWNMDLAIAAKKTTDWTSIDVIDNYTIRVNIPAYTNTLLTNLARDVTMMTSKEYVDKNGIEAARWHPVGTGPFIFNSFERDTKITYKRNPNYWDTGKPYLDGVEFIVISDATVRKLAFQKGDIDQITISGLDAQELQKAGYTMVIEGGGTFALVPDSVHSNSPWSKLNVRLAASYAIDREEFSAALGYGFTHPAYQLYPGFEQTAIPNLDKHLHDTARAKALLKEAGYPNGLKTVMHLMPRTIPDNYATALTGMLKEAGIDAEIDKPTAGKYEEMRYGTWDGILNHGFINYTNAAGMTDLYWAGLQFKDVKLPTGFAQGVTAMKSTKEPQKELIQNVIRLMHDDVMVIPYIEESRMVALGKGVHDPDLSEFGIVGWRPQNAWIEASARRK
jgi:ABC-type transport system substrate-binding protein